MQNLPFLAEQLFQHWHYKVWTSPRSLAATNGMKQCSINGHSTSQVPIIKQCRLFSLPPGTKMFQFPGLSSYTYIFSAWYAVFNSMGYPIRRSPDQRLLTTSPKRFVGSHVLHRRLMSRHPPSTLCALMLMLVNIWELFCLPHFFVARSGARRRTFHSTPPSLLTRASNCAKHFKVPLGPTYYRTCRQFLITRFFVFSPCSAKTMEKS